MVRRSSPENHAVPLITKARLDGWDFQSEKILVNDKFFEIGSQKLFFLLGVSLGPVSRVESLNLSLTSWPQVSRYIERDVLGSPLTGFSSQALIKAMYGFSPGLSTMPERSSSLFCASGNGSCPVILEAEVAIDSSFSNQRLFYPEAKLKRL